MFAPDHARAAAEMLRVCRPGGTIALAGWTPDGFVDDLSRTVGAHVPPSAGVPSPMLWGAEGHPRELFGDGIESLDMAERMFTFRFASAEGFVRFFRLFYGPTVKAFDALDRDGRDAHERVLVELVRRPNRLDGDAVAVPYTEAVATRHRGRTRGAPGAALSPP